MEQTARADDTFFDCALTRREAWTLAVALALTVVLQFAASLGTTLGTILLLGLACLCWTTPVTALYYISCSQVLPFPPDSPYNPAQIGFLTWPLVIVFTRRRFDLRGVSALLVLVPFLIWVAVVGQEYRTIFRPRSEYMKAIFYAAIACHYVNAAGGRYLKLLLGLCVGAETVVLGFWARQVGLPVMLLQYSEGLSRAGFDRLGGARADSVMVWPPVLLGLFGIIGMALTLARRRRHDRQTRALTWLAVALTALSVPPIVATMTHGAYFGFVLMSLAVVAALISRTLRRGLALEEKRRLLRFVLIPTVAVALIFQQNLFGVRARVDGLLQYYRQMRETGAAAASRTDVWRYSLRTIAEHPWLGIRFTNAREEIPPQYRADGHYLSHNVFLDYARYGGIPGMLLALWVFFDPWVRTWRLPDRSRYFAFFLAYFAMFIFWMTLSFQFYKTFWALWMLLALMARRLAPRAACAARAESCA